MNTGLNKKVLNRLESLFGEMVKVLEALKQDLDFSLVVLQKDPANQMVRRMAIRNFCAFAEGTVHGWKNLTLEFHKVFASGLTHQEIAALREETSEVDSNGKAGTRRMNIPFQHNFKFACNTYRRVFLNSYEPDFGVDSWQKVIEVFKVRDRLMHPKASKSVEVEDAEILALKQAFFWLNEVGRKLPESWETAKIQERVKISKASEPPFNRDN